MRSAASWYYIALFGCFVERGLTVTECQLEYGCARREYTSWQLTGTGLLVRCVRQHARGIVLRSTCRDDDPFHAARNPDWITGSGRPLTGAGLGRVGRRIADVRLHGAGRSLGDRVLAAGRRRGGDRPGRRLRAVNTRVRPRMSPSCALIPQVRADIRVMWSGATAMSKRKCHVKNKDEEGDPCGKTHI